jgi:hypothetical protein
VPDDLPTRGSAGGARTEPESSAQDTRSYFDEIFGPGEGDAIGSSSIAIPVSEILGTVDAGPATVATPRVREATAAAPLPAVERPRPAQARREEDPEFWGEPDGAQAKVRRRDRGRVRARKVRRIVRHVEPWSVLKVSLFFFLTLWLITLVAGVMIWSVAVNAGGIESVEDFIENLMGYEEFHFLADQIFRAYALGGLVVCVGLAAFSVVVTLIFNLISDLMGGIRVTVIEEERIRRG